jgi:hypothetical protein
MGNLLLMNLPNLRYVSSRDLLGNFECHFRFTFSLHLYGFSYWPLEWLRQWSINEDGLISFWHFDELFSHLRNIRKMTISIVDELVIWRLHPFSSLQNIKVIMNEWNFGNSYVRFYSNDCGIWNAFTFSFYKQLLFGIKPPF